MIHPPARSLLRSALVALPALLLVLGACGAASGEEGDDGDPGPPPQSAEAGEGVEQARKAPMRGTAWVIFGADTVVAEVARTPEERAEGLMYREEVPEGTGMLFVFEEPSIRSFWMENTYVPLDIAFIDEGFRIVDIQRMEPETTDLHESAEPALFALEVAAGWFGERGVEVGDTAVVVFGG